MQSYSRDLRVRFLRAIAVGASARAAGRRFELTCSRSAATSLCARWPTAWWGSGASPRPCRRSGGSTLNAASRSKKTAHAAEQWHARVEAGRWAWFEGQIDLEPERLVFVDG